MSSTQDTGSSTAPWTEELEQWLQRQARVSGFDLAGIAPVDPSPSSADRLTEARFRAWIEAGHAGEMEYLKRRDDQGALLRSDVRKAIPWARSVIVCAMNYDVPAPLSIEPAAPDRGWIARYAWSGSEPKAEPGSEPGAEGGRGHKSNRRPRGEDTRLRTESTQLGRGSGAAAGSGEQSATNASHGGFASDWVPAADKLVPTDYHHELLGRLHVLEAALQLQLPCQTRCYVDTGPILERAAAATAGIGWVGKNTCVLNEQLGSWLLLAIIVTSIPIASGFTLSPAADRCGSCTRCIDACPTDALIAPRHMDASRCISYLTIEKKGLIPEALRPLLGRQVFGCDICQEVCPWNSKSRSEREPVTTDSGMRPRAGLINPSLAWLASLDAKDFKRYFKNSPLERTRRKRLLRNVAIAMGNSGQAQFLSTLEAWAARPEEDPVLAEAARWAVTQLQTPRQPQRDAGRTQQAV
ncbi:MAG: tRNA epoxyqueuosine(34) reductase QueG [Acidobacteriota bacterium]|nr:tRNA epoxyqueuosine(34) reductase QueG [Acidobacteriota bacterium]